jgi:hypothetical protein
MHKGGSLLLTNVVTNVNYGVASFFGLSKSIWNSKMGITRITCPQRLLPSLEGVDLKRALDTPVNTYPSRGQSL